jgi:hypothetical protein
MFEKLYENLNRLDFKRVQASANVTAGGPDEHFYNEVYPNELLRELNETGYQFALWGEEVMMQKKNSSPIRLFIGKGPIGFAPVGLRWCRGLDDWKNTNKQTREVADFGGYKIWRPQIIVTMRPLSLLIKWQDKCSARNNETGEAKKLIQSKVMSQPEWKSVEIIPLRVTLRIKGYSSAKNHYANGISTTPDSRVHNSDREFEKNSEFKELMEKEDKFISDFEKHLRSLDAEYGGKSW